MATDEHRAAALIRDHVVPLVRARGHAQAVGPTSQTMWEAGPFRFALRTALSPTSPSAGAPGYAGAQAEKEVSRMLPNGLDVWRGDRVLGVEWDAGELAVAVFRRGPWEQEALALR